MIKFCFKYIYLFNTFGRLFYHIAEDEEVANAILDRIEAENLEGDTQFYTLKNLQCKSIGTDPINVSFQ